MQILAATDFSTRSTLALRRAGLLAASGDNQLHILHVVDEDQPEELIRVQKREAERVLRKQTDSMAELHGTQAHLSVAAGDPFNEILLAAAETGAHLIVMGSHRKQLLLDIFVGTTIERVIRNGSFPVLMVNQHAQRRYERVVAPIDMSDASVNALWVARATGLIGDAGATLLHAFSALAKDKLSVAESDSNDIDSYVIRERQRVTDQLEAFLAASDVNFIRWSLRVEEGGPMEVISRAVTETHPDLLVMGTHGRSALLKC